MRRRTAGPGDTSYKIIQSILLTWKPCIDLLIKPQWNIYDQAIITFVYITLFLLLTSYVLLDTMLYLLRDLQHVENKLIAMIASLTGMSV